MVGHEGRALGAAQRGFGGTVVEMRALGWQGFALGVFNGAIPFTLIAWGERESDEFRRQSTQLHAAWLAAGNRGELLALPEADHFSAVEGFTSPDSTVVRWIVDKMR